MTIFEKALVIHLICDWLLQSHWIANNKMWLSRSPAGWLHGFIHFLGMNAVFPYEWSLVVALLHIIIDTRIPLKLWFKLYGQTTMPEIPEQMFISVAYKKGVQSAIAIDVAMWCDQVLHIVVIVLVIWLSSV